MLIAYTAIDGDSCSLVVKFWYELDRYLTESWPCIRRFDALGPVCESIQRNKPARVFVTAGDKQHKVSTTTVALIIEGKMTPADLLAE